MADEFDYGEVSLSDEDMEKLEEEFKDEMKQNTKTDGGIQKKKPKISLTDKRWEKDYVIDPKKKQWNLNDLYDDRTDIWKHDFSNLTKDHWVPPEPEIYEQSWNQKMMKERSHQFNYESDVENEEGEVVEEKGETDAKVLAGLWR